VRRPGWVLCREHGQRKYDYEKLKSQKKWRFVLSTFVHNSRCTMFQLFLFFKHIIPIFLKKIRTDRARGKQRQTIGGIRPLWCCQRNWSGTKYRTVGNGITCMLSRLCNN
jgi:hypothetical protein